MASQMDIRTLEQFAHKFEEDAGYLVEHCVSANRHCYWSLSRALFPIAESLAWMLHPSPSPQNTSAQLTWFIENVMSDVNPRYREVAHCLCQMWRHSLAHADVPPMLRHPDGRKLSWSVSLHCFDNHLEIERYGRDKVLHFSIQCFYLDLLAVARDRNQLSRLTDGVAYERYLQWSELVLSGGERSARGKAAQEMATLLDAFQKKEREEKAI